MLFRSGCEGKLGVALESLQGPLVQHATAAADRRRRNGQRIGTAAGPGGYQSQRNRKRNLFFSLHFFVLENRYFPLKNMYTNI